MQKLTKLSLIALFLLCSVWSYAQDRVVVTSLGTDCSYRISRTVVHMKGKNPEVTKDMNSASELFGVLKGRPISLWVNYSHGNDSRLFGKIRKTGIAYYSSGLMLDEQFKPEYGHESSRSLQELKAEIDAGSIQFANDALIILHACAVASPNDETGKIFAQELANVTGAKVVTGQHKTEPVIEDYTQLVYSNTFDFVLFERGKTPQLMGDRLYLTKMVKEYFRTNGQYDFSDYNLKDAASLNIKGGTVIQTPTSTSTSNNAGSEKAPTELPKMEQPKKQSTQATKEETKPTSQPKSQPTTQPTSQPTKP